MAVKVRASDGEREDTVAWLRVALGEARLEPDEFEERVQLAYGARTREELALLTEDLPRAARTPSRGRRRPSRARIRARQLAAYVGVNATLTALWMGDVGAADPLVVGNSDFPWPLFSIVGWGSALGLSMWRGRRRCAARARAPRELTVR